MKNSDFSAQKRREKFGSDSKISGQIKMLDTSSDKTAEKVIQNLSAMGKSAVPSLIKAAKNKETPRIRKWSLQALGAIGDRRAAPLLVEALKDERMTVRFHAVKGLSRKRYKKGVKAIASLLKDESGGVRVNALYALIEIEDSSPAQQIQKLLSDPQWYIRQTAYVACGKLGIAKAKKKLIQLSEADERKSSRKNIDFIFFRRAVEQCKSLGSNFLRLKFVHGLDLPIGKLHLHFVRLRNLAK